MSIAVAIAVPDGIALAADTQSLDFGQTTRHRTAKLAQMEPLPGKNAGYVAVQPTTDELFGGLGDNSCGSNP